MANYSTLKAAVADVVKTNGTQAITGANLQAVLLSIINSVGGGGYIFKGVATPSTDAGTPDENVFYLGGAGTYANFGTSITVPVGSIGVFKYNGSWAKEQIALYSLDDVPTENSDNLVKSGGVAASINQLDGQINGVDNSETISFQVTTGVKVAVTLAQKLKTGTYTVSSPNYDALLTGLTLYFRRGDNTEILHNTYSAIVRNGLTLEEDCESIYFYAVSSSVIGTGELVINFTDTNPTYGIRGEIQDAINAVETLDNRIFDGNIDVTFEQGNYYNGNKSDDLYKVRYNRLFSASELPITISVPTDCEAKIVRLLLYGDSSDYSSFISNTAVPVTYSKEIILDSSILNGAGGVTILFGNEDANLPLDPSMMTGVVTKYYTIKDQLNEIAPVDGITYFGDKIDINIKDQKNKMQAETIVEHTPSSYRYTRYNQSMAIYGGVAFCFNDTNGADDCFCVAIDVSSGEVLARIDNVPSVITALKPSSHLNNANFTDVFYSLNDDYPLLLLSRGDYADRTANDQEMYIFRITPSGSSFVFNHIKTIKHRGTYYFNPSWEYDSQRKMIWGHNNIHGDWRWNDTRYRKFDGFGLYFSAYSDTQYVTIVSDENAASNADITITIGTSPSVETKTVSIQAGEPISPAAFVMPYVLNVGGYSYISVSQSAAAFDGQYTVCACDANGNNRIPINFGCVLVGFHAPDLCDGTEVTITADDMTQEVEIDPVTFQGGCCFAGKQILPCSGFKTINGQPVSNLGQVCIVVDPTNGGIVSAFPTGNMENEGCAIYDGKIYISSHYANASSDSVSFNIIAYSFD